VVASGLVHGRGDHIVDTAVKQCKATYAKEVACIQANIYIYISPVGWSYANQKMPRLGGDKLSALL
jgi:hypothetical protein